MVSTIAKTLGVGSGIDISQLVADLSAASREPKIQRLEKRQSAVQSQISALAQARADFEALVEGVSALVADGALRTQPSVSDASVLGAAFLPGSPVTTLSTEVELLQLARGQTLISPAVTDPAAPIGQGPFNLVLGSHSYALTIGPDQDSLTGLAAAINGLNSGVTAQVQPDQGAFRLILRGPSGAANDFTLQGPGDFAYPPANGQPGMALAQSARDALLKVDGVSYTRASNQVDDVVAGVSLTLRKPNPGAPVTLGVTSPTSALRTAVSDVAAALNSLMKKLEGARSGTASRVLVELERKLSRLTAQPLTKEGGGPRTLADLGVATNRDGSISLDTKKLDTALRNWPAAVEAIFAPQVRAGASTGLIGALQSLKDDALSASGGMDALKARLEKEATFLSSQKDLTEKREAAYKERLTRNFAGMDTRVAAFKATQSYLEQQIAQWNRTA